MDAKLAVPRTESGGDNIGECIVAGMDGTDTFSQTNLLCRFADFKRSPEGSAYSRDLGTRADRSGSYSSDVQTMGR